MAPSPKFVIGPKKISSHVASCAVKKHQVPSSSQSSQHLNIEERVELKKLASILPAQPSNGDPADVVLRAASYIDQLVATVQARVKNGTLPIDALQSLPPVYSNALKLRRPNTTITKKPRRSMEKKR